MKGLFVHDLLWFGEQKRLLVIYILLAVLYLATDMGAFALGMLPLLTGLIELRTIMADLEGESRRYFFTLPFSRSQYVAEKYLAALGLPMALSIVLMIAIGLLHSMSWQQAAMTAVECWLVEAVFLSIMIPLVIRFKSKISIWMMVVSVAVVLLMLLFEDYAPQMAVWFSGFSIPQWMQSDVFVLSLSGALALLAVIIGVLCSRRLMAGEEI